MAQGMVFTAQNLPTDPPAWTYRWFFRRAFFTINTLWAHAHGWRSQTGRMVAAQKAREAHARMPLVDEAFTFVDSATGKQYSVHGKSPRSVDGAHDRKRWDAASAVCGDTHIWEFGAFYKHCLQFLCPTLGFALFWILAPHGQDTRSLADAKRRENAIQDVVGGSGAGDGVDGA
jgi:hypothetical protein